MSEVLTLKKKKAKKQSELDEKKILREIEESFCVAGYEIVESVIFKESVRKAKRA